MFNRIINNIELKIVRYLNRIEKNIYFNELRHNFTAKGRIILTKDSKIINQQNNKEKIIINENCSVKGELLIFPNSGEIVIGQNTYIGEATRIWSQSRIVIGNNVLISHNVNIHDTDSHPMNTNERLNQIEDILVNNKYDYSNYQINSEPIEISDNAWIGFNSIILKGVKIGKNSIVACGSVVTKDVPENAIVAGNPAKIIKQKTHDIKTL